MPVERNCRRKLPVYICRIWHDNSGKSPSWYFGRMQVTDLQTDDRSFFLCDRWLAVEADDGMVGLHFNSR